MARPRNTDQRRAQIVAALGRVVARAGLPGATMADVAAEAGLAQGLLHYHFGGKHDMVVALVDHLGAQTEVRFATYAAIGARPRLRAWLDALAAGAAVELELATEARRDPAIGAAWARLVASRSERVEGLLAAVAAAEGRSVPRLADALLASVAGHAALGGAAGHDALVDRLLGPAPAGAVTRPTDDWALWR